MLCWVKGLFVSREAQKQRNKKATKKGHEDLLKLNISKNKKNNYNDLFSSIPPSLKAPLCSLFFLVSFVAGSRWI
jgi:hypothetical protein